MPNRNWSQMMTDPGTKVDDYRLTEGQNPENITGEDFDELVVGKWFHMERLDDNVWWMAFYGPDKERTSLRVILNKSGEMSRVLIDDDDRLEE